MTPARQQQLLQNQTSLARKVYEAVPSLEPWAASRIFGTVTGNHSMSTIGGVLADLKDQGLIKEVSRLRYIRVEVKPTLADQLRVVQEERQTKQGEVLDLRPKPLPEEVFAYEPSPGPVKVEFTEPQAGKPATAFDRLFELSQKVRSAAAAHHNAIAELADGIEAVAVEIGAEHEANVERTEQLRKLKLALNAIGGL